MRQSIHPILHILLILGLLIISFGSVSAPPVKADANKVVPADQGGVSGFGDFHMLSEDQGWVVVNNQLYWTSDGGNSWNSISSSIPGLTNIAAVDFIDNREGRVLMVSSGGDDPVFSLARTHDGGMTWETWALPLFSPGDVNGLSSDIYMQWLDSQTGWLVIKRATGINFSMGSLFGTTDGGQTWTQLSIPVGEPVVFITPLIGWVAGGAAGNELYRTGDGGATWISQDFVHSTGTANQQFAYFLPKFQDATNGLLPVMITDGNYARMDFYSTSDGGQLWRLENSNPLDGNVDLSIRPPLTVFDASHFYMVVPHSDRIVAEQGSQGIITNYNQDGRSANLTRLDMVNMNVGFGFYTAGGCYAQPSIPTTTDTASKANLSCLQTNQLLKTTDGGASWNVISLPVMAGTVPSGNSLLSKTNSPVKISAPLFSPYFSYDVLAGQGIDICDIPTSSQLQAWWANSPYGAVNLYIGGALRGCRNSMLNSTLVSQLFQQGWKFIPTWVGPQAPCTSFRVRIDYNLTTAFNQGVAEADAATTAAFNLGLTNLDGSNTIIYYDLEAYDTSNSSCRNAMKSFMNGWDQELAAKGNKSGVYGSVCASAMTDFLGITHVPDAVWLAWWNYSTYNSNASVFGVTCISNSYWANHQRVHQYAGAHNETWGGITLNVDDNVMDGPMAVPYQGATNNAPIQPINPKPIYGGVLPRINDTWLYWSTNGTSCNLHLWGGNIDTTPTGNCASQHVGQLAPGTYNWQVTANNAYGSTVGPAWRFGIQPYAPIGLSLATVTSTQIDLGWTASADDPANLDGYDIYFNNVDIGGVPNGTVSASIVGLACNTAYTIFLRSDRQNVQSVNSNTVTTTTGSCTGGTPTTPPPTATPTPTPTNTPVPGGLAKVSPANNSTGLPTSLTLSWGGSSDVSYYLYCYDTINNNICDRFWSATYSTSASIDGLAPGQIYYWEVAAIKSSGASYLDNATWWNFSVIGGSPTLTAVPSSTVTPVVSPTTTSTPTATQTVVSPTPSLSSTPTPSASPTSTGTTPAGSFGKIGPADQSTGLSSDVGLTWGSVSGALYYLYCVDTSNNGICNTYWLSSGSTNATVNGLTPGATYSWEVVAIKSNGSVYADGGLWWGFSVSGIAPTQTPIPPTTTFIATSTQTTIPPTATFSPTPTPTQTVSGMTITPSPTATMGGSSGFTKLSPPAGSMGNPTTVLLSWSAFSGANYYLYCYDLVNNNICDTYWITDYQVDATITSLTRGTTFYWQVVAIKSPGAYFADNGTWGYFSTSP
jgi:photosystem II stability/assembly factor-like uncharacterized protein